MDDRPILLDLYSGAGGAGVGYDRAGFRVIGVDSEPMPNYPFEFHQGDALSTLTDIIAGRSAFGEIAAIHTSPPCFPAGTPVVAARGVVPIESITKGELVLTHEGRWRRVTATMSRQAEVVADGWLATTADHPFYSREQLPRLSAKRGAPRRVLTEPEWTPAAALQGRFVAVPTTAQSLPIPSVPGRAVEMSAPFWYMLGRWLGDGWVRIKEADPANRRPHGVLSTTPRPCVNCGKPAARSGRWAHLWNAYCSATCRAAAGRSRRPPTRSDVLICCAKEEADGLASKLMDTGLAWVRSDQRTTTRFAASHIGLTRWIVDNFGRYSHGKTVPGWVFGLPAETRSALLDGYLDADGSTTSFGWSTTTVSVNLAIGVRLLAASLGYGTSVSRHVPTRSDPSIEGRVINERPLWSIRMAHPDRQRQYGYHDSKHWWGKRRTALLPRGIETVYDITVDEDHSFVAWGFVVHNCQASCALIKGNQRATADNHVNLIPATRELLKLTGLPYVIENVQGSDLRRDLTLCGEMFSLGVIRHRYFEVDGFEVTQPAHVPHRGRVRGWRHGEYFDGPYTAVFGEGGGKGSVAEWQVAMGGIDWTNVRKEIAEMIPPAYSYLVGSQLMAHLTAQAA